MGREFSVRCQCGSVSESWKVDPEVLVGAVRESAILIALSKTGWGKELEYLCFNGRQSLGLASFLADHFDHGGYEVFRKYGDDVPVPCRPDMPPGAYEEVCLARIAQECAALEVRLAKLKPEANVWPPAWLKEPRKECPVLFNGKKCTRPHGHDGIHDFSIRDRCQATITIVGGAGICCLQAGHDGNHVFVHQD